MSKKDPSTQQIPSSSSQLKEKLAHAYKEYDYEFTFTPEFSNTPLSVKPDSSKNFFQISNHSISSNHILKIDNK